MPKFVSWMGKRFRLSLARPSCRRPGAKASRFLTTAGTRVCRSRPTAACASFNRERPADGDAQLEFDEAKKEYVPARSRSFSPHVSSPAAEDMVISSTNEEVKNAQRPSKSSCSQPPGRLPDLRPGRRVQAPGLLLRASGYAEAKAHRAGAQAERRPVRADHRLRRRALHHVHALYPGL